MEIYNNIIDLKLKNTAIAIGKFDALHKGHRQLISKIVNKKNMTSCVIAVNFNKSVIFTREERILILEELGIDTLIELNFDDIKNIEYDEFLRLLKNQLDMRLIVCGDDFIFGKDGKGNINKIIEYSKENDVNFEVLSKLCYKHIEISSSRIKKELLQGNIEIANNMLGTNFFFCGKVVLGNQIGRTIGIPTANIDCYKEKVIPPFGVYASKVLIENKIHKAVSNIGVKPTIKEGLSPIIEVNIFDFDDDIYNKEIIVYLYKFLRLEKKYDSLIKLKEAVLQDIENTKNFFTEK